jgi:acyl-CoA synthetase (AMP-forming)/AMP-acid ligase II
VVKEDGTDVKPGEVGEIVVKGGGVMLRYWKKPEATAEKCKDGWMYTVDLATVDEDGYIYIVDRKNNMIITGGENVYPARVESVLYEMHQIAEAVVLGVPDDKWGEAVKAFVVLKPGEKLTQAEVIDFCAQRMANYEKPKSVEFVDSLPHLPTGKLDRVTLKKKISSNPV